MLCCVGLCYCSNESGGSSRRLKFSEVVGFERVVLTGRRNVKKFGVEVGEERRKISDGRDGGVIGSFIDDEDEVNLGGCSGVGRGERLAQSATRIVPYEA